MIDYQTKKMIEVYQKNLDVFDKMVKLSTPTTEVIDLVFDVVTESYKWQSKYISNINFLI